MASDPILIDGSYLEGGGQILRMSLALSCVQGRPITVDKVRAGRKNPGLRPQHLTGLQVVRDMAGGRLDGGHIGSCQISFFPGAITGGEHSANTQTAGSTSLLVQAALPCALYGRAPTYLRLMGGTNVEMAPQLDYTIQVFRKISAYFGAEFWLYIQKRGFFPKGGGCATLEVRPVKEPLHAADFTDFGEVVSVRGKAFVAGTLPIRMAHRMADTAERVLRDNLPRNVQVTVDRAQEGPETACGNGSGIVLWAETSSGCVVGGSCVGKRERQPDECGEFAANEILESVERKACLDKYAQDQVIILMALARGKSVVRTGPLTDHTRTAMHVAQTMTNVKFIVTEDEHSDCVFIECEGIGLAPSQCK